MLLSTLRTGLNTRLRTIDGTTVQDEASTVAVPAAWFGPPTVNYDTTMGRGSDTIEYEIRFLVSNVDGEQATRELEEYLSGHGPKSVRTALCTTVAGDGLGEATIIVDNGTPSDYTPDGGGSYKSILFTVAVTVSGTT